ncbi:MAG TPA: AAA family ATPase [Candidatus Dormibacteraeota bacterium]|nr:AAA family ATPase [Candidatus Dormibacteraeota bacterium]
MPYSRFHLTDLQVHTPADPDHEYGPEWGPDPDPAFAELLIERFREAGVTVVAVTDHNRLDWYPAVHAAGLARGVFAFPGLEISVDGCHLVAVWEASERGFELGRRFLATLWAPGESAFDASGRPRVVSRRQVLEVAELAVQHRALVLAPHATAPRSGLFGPGVCRSSDQVAQSGLIAGFDVHGSAGADVLVNPRRQFGQVRPAWFLSGDTRRWDGIGERATYLKTDAEPTLEGLRQAFLVAETRVRLPERLRSRWGHVRGARFLADPHPEWPRLTRVRVDGGFHDGLAVDLAPGLNAVIGGKGTGKSTLIEILRYVLDAGRPVDRDAAANRKHNFRANAEAGVGFVDPGGDEYEVRRSGDGGPPLLLRDGRETGLAAGRRVAVRVFGQRELQTLADRPEMLRDFVAGVTRDGWEQVTGPERELVAAVDELDRALTALEDELARLGDEEQELRDLRDRLALAESRGVTGWIRQSQELNRAQRGVAAMLGWPPQVGEAAAALERLLPAPSPPQELPVPPGLAGALGDLEEVVRRAAADLRAGVERAAAGLSPPAAEWEAEHARRRHDVEARLAEAGISDPRQLRRIQQRAAELEERLRELPVRRERQAATDAARREALRRLAEVRRRKSRLVEAAARTLSEALGPRVRLAVRPLADRGPLAAELEAALHGQGVRSDQLQRLAQAAPGAIGDAIREGPAAVAALGCSPSTASKLASLPRGAVRRLEAADTPDQVVVEIDLGRPGGESWSPISEVSPGQRAMALLALALASGAEPLVIDQPEDDLDNRYIYDEVVRVLSRVCEGRQVIVATHNANIPVLGDAELVLALDADADRGRVLACGGLESADVANQARQILEGGDQAFLARHRRYLAAER